MNPKDTTVGLRRFCLLLFSVFAIVGCALYYFYGKGLLGGLGLSAAILSIVSFFHFIWRKNSDGKIETNLTWLLLVFTILGVIIIFINKFKGGPDFIYGLGGGVSFVAAVSFVMELIYNFKNGIR